MNTDVFWVGFRGLPTLSAKHSASIKLSTEGHYHVPGLCLPLSCPDLLFPLFFFLLAASRVLWQVHRCPSSLRDELGGSCRRTGTALGRHEEHVSGPARGQGLLAWAVCCLPQRQLVSQSISLSFFFFFFADGIGDVLSHLRKQVEILFNTRYGKMVINTCSSCRVPASAAGSS